MLICANCKGVIGEGQSYVLSSISQQPMHDFCKSTCTSCASYITDEESLKNQFKCNKCLPTKVGEVVTIEQVRRSYIELYKNCPHAFNLIAVKQVEIPNGVYALHGIILHELFDLYSCSDEKDKIELEEMFKERFYKEVPENHLDFKEKPELREALYEKGLVAIANYVEYERTATPPFITEEKIEFEVGENLPKVSITMDRLNKVGDDYHLVDYKCGKVFSGQKLVNDLQLPLYALAIKSRYGKLPKTFTFLFFSENKERVYELREDGNYVCQVGKRVYVSNVTEAIREVKQILGDISKGKFNVPQSIQSWYCNRMCGLFKYEMCQGRDVQRWKL